ncbi:methyl-accepting chemotaxis protein [Novispirillum itersonii]|uniref:Methyl-accepting chemotaxis protein n=1 Tax=Novispirillum itersonii TaxID=189 RepID=A0A7X0DN19_NOVIT|nr:HAMP domain-containing methyl-accepting chemotaxis protein [Novispirillum itersonii]MBB6211636.1 methyl-accepting chemotaxis protein [Novispirillum itersonii]
MRTLSIRAVVGLFLAAIGCVALIYGGIDLAGAWARKNNAQVILISSEASRTLLDTLLNTRLERGVLSTGLVAENAASQAHRDSVAGYRKAVEEGYAAVVEKVRASGRTQAIATLADLQKAHDAMVAAQKQFDQDLTVPRSARTASSYPQSQALYQDFLTALTATSNAVDMGIFGADTLVDSLLVVKRGAWATRVQLGGLMGNVQRMVAGGKSWTPQEARAAFEDRGKALVLWNGVREAMASPGLPPSLKMSFQKADDSNFTGKAWDDAKALHEALADGRAPGIEIKDLQPRDTANSGKIVDLASDALNEMVSRAEDVRTDAWQGVYISGAALLATALLVVAGVTMVRSGISIPLSRLNGTMRALAAGDLSADVGYTTFGNEIGEMARSVAVFKDSLIRSRTLEDEAEQARRDGEARRKEALRQMAEELEKTVGAAARAVSEAAQRMDESARGMSDSAASTLRQSTSVSAAAEQASTNVAAVAGAAEELGASVGEISRQVDFSADRAQAAVGEAQVASDIITELDVAAGRINTIVDLISQIAGQTNLLALNATIEAARAGDLGKGFAVVANEVKALATQTGAATAQIGQQVSAIQGTTMRAVRAISSVVQAIGAISEASQSIVVTINQQDEATREIVQSVAQASAGTQEVTEIISDVASAAGQTEQDADGLLKLSGTLTDHARTLQEQMAGFLKTLRSA